MCDFELDCVYRCIVHTRARALSLPERKMYPPLTALTISMKRQWSFGGASDSPAPAPAPAHRPYQSTYYSAPSEDDLRQFVNLVQRGEVELRQEPYTSTHWVLKDKHPFSRTPEDRVWKKFGFRWDGARWFTNAQLPDALVQASTTRRDMRHNQANEDYEQMIRNVLNQYRSDFVDQNNRLQFVLRHIFKNGEPQTVIEPRSSGMNMYTYRPIWNAMKLYYDRERRLWMGPVVLTSIVNDWHNEELHRRRREAEEQRRRREEQRRQMEEARQREAEERRRREVEAARRLAKVNRRLNELKEQARSNPNNLSEDERREYEDLRNEPGVVQEDYLPWATLYEEAHNEIRRKIIQGEALTAEEANFLMSHKSMAIQDALEATRSEIEDMEVNERLRRNPATSIATEQAIDPVWVAHVVNAVLELTERLTANILRYLSEHNLNIATTRVPQETRFETPLGTLRVFVRNQAAAQRVVWNVYFVDEGLRAIAERALLDANYVQPVQIREAKSLIIAMNAVAKHFERLRPGPNGIEREVREWARQKPTYQIVLGSSINRRVVDNA